MLSRTLFMSVVSVSRHLRRDSLRSLDPVSRFPVPTLRLENTPVFRIVSTRNYAKGKDRKKEAKSKKKVEVNENVLNEIVDIDKIKQDMEINIEKMNEMFVKHLSIRSSVGSIEQLTVALDGKKYPLMEVGQIIRNNPKTIVINLAAFPQAIPAVLKALSDSGMNLNPQQDGTTLYVPVPKVTKEHRESMAKNAKTHFIKCRDGIRDVQNSCSRSLKNKEKDGLASDLSHQALEQIKSVADDYIAQAEKMLTVKQGELLGG